MSLIETPSLKFIIKMVIYDMDIDQLTDNLTFELDNYILIQSSFLEKGLWIKVSFKKPMINFDKYEICSKILRQTFITVEQNHFEEILSNIYKFNFKKNKFPFIIDGSKEISISILDEKNNNSFNEIIISEKPTFLNKMFFNTTTKHYLANPEILKIINDKKYFYLKIEGLKSINVESNLDLVLEKVKEKHSSYIKKSINQIKNKYYYFYKDSNQNKKILDKISKINLMIDHPKVFQNELLKIDLFLKDLSVCLSNINRTDNKRKFLSSIKNINLKKISIRNSKKSLLFKTLNPEDKPLNFIMKFYNNNISLIREGRTYVSK